MSSVVFVSSHIFFFLLLLVLSSFFGLFSPPLVNETVSFWKPPKQGRGKDARNKGAGRVMSSLFLL